MLAQTADETEFLLTVQVLSSERSQMPRKKQIMCHPVQLELEKGEKGVGEHARFKTTRA